MSVSTIGFTRTSARHFFERLRAAGVRTVIDVRLHNTSQLAGFAKASDLAYFLEALGGIGYRHAPELAPSDELFAAYRRKKGLDWDAFAARFVELMRERRIEEAIQPADLDGACLLCSEDTPHRCHRRLVLEYLEERWGRDLDVRHL